MTRFFRLFGLTICLIPALAAIGSPAVAGSRKTAAANKVDAVARRAGLAGEVLVARGGRILLDRGYGTIAPSGGAQHRAGERWRLASITKQVTAALIVRDLATKRRLNALDEPNLSKDLPNFFGLTLRQLLTHHSGLANPDDTLPNAEGVPIYYASDEPDLRYCNSKRAQPGAPFRYNNCDYDIASAWLGLSPDWPIGMAMAQRGEVGVPGFVGGKPEPHVQLANYGAAGGLIGRVRAVFDFNRSLMTGKLLPPAALAELWKPEGGNSYQALGQWVFPGQLKGCAKPKRIVQRDGEIFGVQARNFIFPDDDLVVIVFTNRSSDDFAMGEVWEGKGFSYNLLSAAACG